MKYIIVGMATGSREIETWSADTEEMCKGICSALVRETGHKAYVIEGKIVGTYELEDLPVKYIPQ